MTQRFDPLAEVYARSRPTYPDGLYDALPLDGATVLDVGAGTGISSRGMAERGATVYAFDLAARMLALNTVPRAVADAHALPVRDGAADLVTYAQAFHWVDAERAVPEMRRVLRDGGAAAVWWNNSDARSERWWQVQQETIEALNRGYGRNYRDYSVHDPAADLAIAFDDVTTHDVPWARTIDMDTYLVYLSSKSYVAALGDRMPEFLEGQRALMTEAFPDGVVTERFVTHLWVAR